MLWTGVFNFFIKFHPHLIWSWSEVFSAHFYNTYKYLELGQVVLCATSRCSITLYVVVGSNPCYIKTRLVDWPLETKRNLIKAAMWQSNLKKALRKDFLCFTDHRLTSAVFRAKPYFFYSMYLLYGLICSSNIEFWTHLGNKIVV